MKQILAYNMFKNDLCDSIFYVICYCVFPVTVTASSLKIEMSILEFVYFYFTIFVCVLGSFYDAVMRIRKAETSFERVYLFCVSLPSVIIGGYSIVMMMNALITKTVCSNYNWIFLCYFIAVFIAFFDLCTCILNSLLIEKNIH